MKTMKVQDTEVEVIPQGALAEKEGFSQKVVKGARNTGSEQNCGFHHEGSRELQKHSGEDMLKTGFPFDGDSGNN